MTFFDKLHKAVEVNHSLLCVGLDPTPELMPLADAGEFCRAVVEATADLVCAYKLNLAFFEALGEEGMAALRHTLAAVPKEIPVIADAKRGDIASTAVAYAKALFDVWGFDAATVNPYLGGDALRPFLERRDKGVFVLCRTSNPGAVDLQDLPVAPDGRPLFLVVAELASRWNEGGNVGLVVGATYPEELLRVRQTCPDMTILVPGVGPQGGDLAQAVSGAANEEGAGFVINASRRIIYAGRDRDFARAARQAAQTMRDEINRVRASLPTTGG
ncbi:MAG: orotidine-5'-phosphate decarboxylase [Dehalococcoidia bacterium]